MKRLFCYLLATLGVLCHLTARNIDTAFMRQLPKVDIHSENFNILVDSLTTNMKTEELFGVMFAAGSQAEQEGDVRLQAIYYDKAAGYAQSNGNMNGMVEALLRSSKANRIRNYAGTSIRQLAAAEQAVADDAALRNRVNEAQIENYEALGDIVNA